MRISDWSSDVCSSDLLEEKGRNSEEVWTSITVSQGSVQHLDFLNDDEKDVFKTAFELDQRWLIEHAGDRAPFICKAQSLNVFVPADVHNRDLHQTHFRTAEHTSDLQSLLLSP